jgi:hypothetical protein
MPAFFKIDLAIGGLSRALLVLGVSGAAPSATGATGVAPTMAWRPNQGVGTIWSPSGASTEAGSAVPLGGGEGPARFPRSRGGMARGHEAEQRGGLVNRLSGWRDQDGPRADFGVCSSTNHGAVGMRGVCLRRV